jgi:hypothetical protein
MQNRPGARRGKSGIHLSSEHLSHQDQGRPKGSAVFSAIAIDRRLASPVLSTREARGSPVLTVRVGPSCLWPFFRSARHLQGPVADHPPLLCPLSRLLVAPPYSFLGAFGPPHPPSPSPRSTAFHPKTTTSGIHAPQQPLPIEFVPNKGGDAPWCCAKTTKSKLFFAISYIKSPNRDARCCTEMSKSAQRGG